MNYNLDRIKKLIEEIEKSNNLKYIKSKILDIKNYIDDELELVNRNLEKKNKK